MLCERCQKREARVCSTTIIEGESSTVQLCEQCFKTHYPDQFAQGQAIMEAGCRWCGQKCGMAICRSCLAEYQRVKEAKGISDLPEDTASEQDKLSYAQRTMELMEHMRAWGAARGPGPSAYYEESTKAFEKVARLSLFDPVFAELARADSRFKVQAYMFVVRALDRAAPGEDGHVSGRELALAFRALALEEFGKGALKTLIDLGVYTTDDIGTIVYQLIEAGRFGKRPEDKIEDFHALYDFAEAFPAD